MKVFLNLLIGTFLFASLPSWASESGMLSSECLYDEPMPFPFCVSFGTRENMRLDLDLDGSAVLKLLQYEDRILLKYVDGVNELYGEAQTIEGGLHGYIEYYGQMIEVYVQFEVQEQGIAYLVAFY